MRIYATDAGGRHPIHGAWYNDIEERWNPITYDTDGCFVGAQWPRSVDLVL